MKEQQKEEQQDQDHFLGEKKLELNHI